MSQLSTAAVLPHRRHIMWISYVSLAVLFIGLLAIGQYAVRQLVAGPRLEQYKKSTATDWESLEQHFHETTHAEGTAAWSKIYLMCRRYDQKRSQKFAPLLSDGVSSEVRSIQQDLDWPKERERLEGELDAFLDEMQPLVELIHEASQVAMPVWQPIVIDGGYVNLSYIQDVWQVSHLLSLEVYQAIKDSDSERGLAGIRSLKATADACDWELGWTCILINRQLGSYLNDAVRKSLSTELWDGNQLDQISLLFNQPVDSDQIRRSVLAADRALIFMHPEQTTLIEVIDLMTPEEQLELYKQYDSVLLSAGSSTGKTARQMQEFQLEYSRKKVGSIIYQQALSGVLPNVGFLETWFVEMESQRRLSLTAVGIKRFKMVQKRWPKSLEELAQVGLSIDDWTIPGMGNLGYEETPEGVTVFKFGQTQRRKLIEPLPNSIHRHPDATYDEVLIR